MASIAPDDAARLLEMQGNRAFSIHVPESVWIVEAGRLDLFVVGLSDGAAGGARQHLVSIEPGHAVFGMCTPEENQIAVLAGPVPGTKLRCIPQSYLRHLSHPVEFTAEVDTVALLDKWITSVTRACSAAPLPTDVCEIGAGTVLETTEQPKAVVSTQGILWVEQLRGHSRFFNHAAVQPIHEGDFFPLSRDSWLQLEPQSRIHATDSQEWGKADPEWRSLQVFHRAVLQCLSVERRLALEKERKRLLSQADSDSVVLRGALRSLVSPLLVEEVSQAVAEDGANDPVFLACEAVGRSLGVKMKLPAGTLCATVLKNPIATIAMASALRTRVVALTGKWWINGNTPLVAFRDADNAPLALLPGARRGYRLYDPATRKTVEVNAAVALTLNGFAHAFYRPLPNEKLSAGHLLAFGLGSSKRELLTIVLMGIGSGLLAMIVPVATGMIFNSVIPGAQRDQLLLIAVFLVMSTLAASIFSLTRSFATLRLEGKVGSCLQAAIWDRLLRLPVPFFRAYSSGDLADRSLGIEYIIRTLTGSTLASILTGVFSIFSFLLLFYYSWQLALIAGGLILVALAVSAASTYLQMRYQRQILQIRGRISGMLLGFFDSIAKLRVSGSEPRAFAVWAREFAAQKTLSMRARNVGNTLAIFQSAFPVVSLAVIFGFAMPLIGQPLVNSLTTGSFLAFMAAYIQFQSAALQLTSTVQSVVGIVPLYERAAPILDALPEVRAASRDPGVLSGSIEINHVNFRYARATPMVLHDVSLSVKPGQFVAIVGHSGSGKSTLLRLLLGFERPESGSIYYDRQELAGLDIEGVRRQMGVVIQSARLVKGSIFDNIVGSAPLTFNDAWEAARLAGLDKDIREMPMGMHTLVSEGGGNISGGQRQRLLIARAMVKKPRLFLLDEATSALDNVTQAKVARSLDGLQATRIVVAHRLSTIINADCIFVLEKGTVVQRGSYDKLMKEEGVFRELAVRQLA